MSTTPGAIVRRGGISRTVFVISLVVVAAASGITGYVIQGVLHPGPTVITLNGAGSTFVNPLLTAMSANYTKANSGVQINYQPVGSTTGITFLGQKTVDFGASDAPLTTSQISVTPNALTIPDTIGAVAIAYNVPINSSYSIHKGLYLNVTIAAEMFQGGTTKGGTMYWNDPGILQLNQNNPNIPPDVFAKLQTLGVPIVVVHRSDGSGTTFVFSSWLSTSPVWKTPPAKSLPSGAWAKGAVGTSGNAGVASTIQSTLDTVGYVELNYAISASPPMSYAFVWNPNGSTCSSQPGPCYIEPTLASSAKAASSLTPSYLPAGSGNWTSITLLNSIDPAAYPIVTFSYIMVYQELNAYGGSMNQARAQALVNFLWFVVHDGQNQSSQLSFVPLPALVVANAEATIRTITYNGNTLHG